MWKWLTGQYEDLDFIIEKVEGEPAKWVNKSIVDFKLDGLHKVEMDPEDEQTLKRWMFWKGMVCGSFAVMGISAASYFLVPKRLAWKRFKSTTRVNFTGAVFTWATGVFGFSLLFRSALASSWLNHIHSPSFIKQRAIAHNNVIQAIRGSKVHPVSELGVQSKKEREAAAMRRYEQARVHLGGIKPIEEDKNNNKNNNNNNNKNNNNNNNQRA